MLEIEIDRTSPDGDAELYETGRFALNEGLTVLVGCNGSGKSTFLERTGAWCGDNGVPFLLYRGTRQARELMRMGTLRGDAGELFARAALSSWMSSGEQMREALELSATDIGGFVGNAAGEGSESCVVAFDDMDSGWSADLVAEFRDFVENVMLGEDRPETALYVLVTANTYEMTRGARCLDVQTGGTVEFGSYDDYRRFVMRSRKRKEGKRAGKSQSPKL